MLVGWTGDRYGSSDAGEVSKPRMRYHGDLSTGAEEALGEEEAMTHGKGEEDGDRASW